MVHLHVLVAVVASPVGGLLVASSKSNKNLKVLELEDLSSTSLINLLRLTVDEELQLSSAVSGDKRDVGLLRDNLRDIVDGKTGLRNEGVASSAENTAPVSILAVESSLDQRRTGNGAGNLASGLLVGGLDDTNSDELGGTLTITDDELGKVGREIGQDSLEGIVIGSVGSNLLTTGSTVGENGNSVVGGSVAIDGDAVERTVDGVLEEGWKNGGRDGSIGGDDTEESGHVGVNHASSLGYTSNAVLERGGGKLERLRDELREGVGGADSLGSREPVVVGRTHSLVSPGDVAGNLLDGETLADNTGAHNESAVALTEAHIGFLGHLAGILKASLASDGVGTSRVDNDTLNTLVALLLQQVAAESDGGGLELVLGEDSGGSTGVVRGDKADIGLGGVLGFDAYVDAGSFEALRVDAGSRDILLLGRGDGAADGGRVRPGLDLLKSTGQLGTRLPQLTENTAVEALHDCCGMLSPEVTGGKGWAWGG